MLFILQGILEAIGVVSIIPLMYAISAQSKEVLLDKLYFLERFLINFELLEIQLIFILIFIIYTFFLNSLITINFIITEKLTTEFYNKLFSNLLDKYFIFNPYSFSKFEISDKINTLSYDLQHSAVYIFRSIFRNLSKIYSLIFIFIVMIIIDPLKTSIFFTFFFLMYFLILRKLGKNLKLMGQDSSFRNREIIKNVKEVFNNLKLIHIDKLADWISPKLQTDGNFWIKSQEKLQINTFLIRVLAEIIAIIVIISLIIFMLLKSQQEFLIATLGFYIYAFYRAFPSMQSIFNGVVVIKGWSKVIESVYEKISDDSKKLNLGQNEIVFNKEISIENLSYKYKEDSSPVFEKLNFKINKGQIIGIKGESGSGKTTFLDTLSGIKSPTDGFIKLDNKKLDLSNVLNWFKKISYVPQKIFFVNDTIRNNILPHDKQVKMYDLSTLLKAVDLDILKESKSRLNLDTLITELNNNLSGGEIQRLSILKALLKNPELIILDETTSGLQIDKEILILKNIKKLFPKLTIILVSHRDKSLEICDEVLRF